MAMHGNKRGRVPVAAALLGASGLLPPLVAIIARLTAGALPDTPLPAFLMLMAFFDASLILAFLGGIWWGVALGRPDVRSVGPLLGLAIAPTVIALLIAALSGRLPKTAAILLGITIIATLLVDDALARRKLVPSWWMRLRVPLSLGLGSLTVALAVLM